METVYTLKVIYRNFRKNLSISLINLSGLVLSIAVTLLLSAYCYNELTTDHHQPDRENTYLITNKGAFSGEGSGIHMPGVLTEYLHNYDKQIPQVVRLTGTWNPPTVKNTKGDVFESGLIFTENGFFDLFNYPVLSGNIQTALNDPSSVILTSAEAYKLFGSYDVIGKTLEIDNKHIAKVAAVIDEPSGNSFLKLKMIMPISEMEDIQPDEGRLTDWVYWDFLTFIKTDNANNPEQTASLIEKIFKENAEGKTDPGNIILMPTDEIYFADIDNSFMDFLVIGDKTKVIVLLMTAILIFIIALVNYLNITAFAMYERQAQNGIFKILGAAKSQVFRNIIMESVLFFIVAVLFAFLLIEIFSPSIQFFTGLEVPDELLFSASFIGISVLSTIILGMLISIFPAVKVSGSGVVANLKKAGTPKTNLFQRALVVFQFTSAIALISFTVLVQKQINFGSANLGFKEENILSIGMTEQMNDEVLKAELSNLPFIKSFSFSRFYPGKSTSYLETEIYDGGIEKIAGFDNFDADGKFAEIMGLNMISGRFFSDSLISDREKVVVNESFVKTHGIENPLGATIRNKYEVIGVVQDFHYKSKNVAIGPLVIFNRGFSSNCFVEVNTADFAGLQNSVETLQGITKRLSPDFPSELSFVDQAVEQMYRSEIQFRRSFTFFAGCAVFISCIGVLALSLFTSLRRTKEIGIRKVNGAQTEDILWLLNKDFLKQLLTACAIAIPIAWFAMDKWLSNYAYQTKISWWLFAVGAIFVFIVVLATVSRQSWKSSARNPVDSLRYE